MPSGNSVWRLDHLVHSKIINKYERDAHTSKYVEAQKFLQMITSQTPSPHQSIPKSNPQASLPPYPKAEF